jgi:hypothetical protein
VIRCLLVVLVLLCAAPASAQVLNERVPNRAERWLLKGCLAFNAFGQAYDGATTVRAIQRGGVESNPALSWITENPKRIWPVKVGMAVTVTWGAVKLADRHPRISAAIACTSGAVGTWAGARNRRTGR